MMTMWQRNVFLLMVLLVPEICPATPDREVHDSDQLIGSNDESYAVLRTQWDNNGSYYTTIKTRSLIEFSKLPEDPENPEAIHIPGKKLSEKQLLKTRANDASVTDSGKHERSTEQRDDSLSMAGVLEKFHSMPWPWPEEKLAKLEVDPERGVRLGKLSLIWSGHVKERFGVEPNADYIWRLAGVSEDSNSLYLQVIGGHQDHPSHRFIALSPQISKLARDHLRRQAVYIVAGRSDNLEDAIKQAQAAVKATGFVLGFEVWSQRNPMGEETYLVCDVNSTKHLAKPGFAALEKKSGLELEVVPGEQLEQMQKTRPRRLRGNREVMIVLGCIIIVGMLMLVNTLNKRLNTDNQRARQASPAQVNVGAPESSESLIITVTLNEQSEWIVAGHGVVSPQELPEIFSSKRAEADEQGSRAFVMAQIAGDQPAKYFMELHRIAEDCQIDEVRVEAQQALLEAEDG